MKQLKELIIPIIKLTIVGACLYYVYINKGFTLTSIIPYIKSNFSVIVLSLVLLSFASFLTILRIYILLNHYYNFSITFKKSSKLILEVLFINNILPFRAGEGLLIYRLKRHFKEKSVFLISKILLMDNVFGVFGLFAVSVCFYPLVENYLLHDSKLKLISFMMTVFCFLFLIGIIVLKKSNKLQNYIKGFSYFKDFIENLNKRGAIVIISISFLVQLVRTLSLSLIFFQFDIKQLLNSFFFIPIGNTILNFIYPSGIGVGNVVFFSLLKDFSDLNPLIYFNIYFLLTLFTSFILYLVSLRLRPKD
ncbi:MAG: flippase-like domain-containing protein [Bdellovibrionales bacterium]|nr:flippase-like domain-containing protein [Bdellovibrionales bacterium]